MGSEATSNGTGQPVAVMETEVPSMKLDSGEAVDGPRSSTSRSSYANGGTGQTARKRSNSRTSSGRNVKSSNDISSASKIFRNLLILEDDLRKQAHKQKVLRWQFTIFLSSLMGVAGFAFYQLYFTGESARGLHRYALQFVLLFIGVTVALFHLGGEYRRTIVIPRKFFTSTNKGIRQFNIKLVKVHSTWNEKFTDFVRFTSRNVARLNISILTGVCRLHESNALVAFWTSVTVRSQPRIGAVDVKLVLNPRSFSAEVREGWEIYRDEFWAREGARRRMQVPSKT